MERILVIGVNGSGKTTLSIELAQKLNLPLVHLDQLYWEDNWQCVSREEFDRRLHVELCKPKWIMDGCMQRTLQERLKYADTVIYLDFSVALGVIGAVKRVIKYHGKTRPDMGGECIERFDKREWGFIRSIFGFNKRNRKNFYRWIQEAEHVKLIVLKNRRQVKKFLKEAA